MQVIGKVPKRASQSHFGMDTANTTNSPEMHLLRSQVYLGSASQQEGREQMVPWDHTQGSPDKLDWGFLAGKGLFVSCPQFFVKGPSVTPSWPGLHCLLQHPTSGESHHSLH